MSKIDNLIQDFIDEYKIFPNNFFIDGSTKILDDDYDPIEKLKNIRGGDIEAGGCDNIDGGLFEVGKIDALNVKDGFHVALRQLHLTVEEFGSVFY